MERLGLELYHQEYKIIVSKKLKEVYLLQRDTNEIIATWKLTRADKKTIENLIRLLLLIGFK